MDGRKIKQLKKQNNSIYMVTYLRLETVFQFPLKFKVKIYIYKMMNGNGNGNKHSFETWSGRSKYYNHIPDRAVSSDGSLQKAPGFSPHRGLYFCCNHMVDGCRITS